MPYTAKQHRVFQAIAHGWKPRSGSLSSISESEAEKMADEGIKRTVSSARKKREIGGKVK